MRRWPLLILFGLIVVAALPVWGVEYFVNQDGPAHVYSAHVANELLRGNEFYAAIYELNPAPVPNSFGHWLLMLLLLVFDKFVAMKLMATLTFAALVSSLLWLRHSSRGPDGMSAVMLLAAAVAFNWLWLQGFYNFIFGLGGFAFTVGLYSRWHGDLTWIRTVLLALAVGLVYFSHLLCFVALAGSLSILATFERKSARMRTIGSVVSAITPSALLYVVFLIASNGAGEFSPVWANLLDPFAITGWFAQLRTADPFLILSRRYVPFVAEPSQMFLIFAPIVWMGLGIGTWLLSYLRRDSENGRFSRPQNAGFMILFGLFAIAALVSPDSLGEAQGSLLRPRMILFASVMLIALLPSGTNNFWRSVAAGCFAVAVLFQATSLLDYSMATDKKIAEIVAAGDLVSEDERIVAVLQTSLGTRFAAEPRVHAGDLLAVNRNVIVWNSFEFGYSFFPVRMRTEADRRFVNELEETTAIIRGSTTERMRIERLRQMLKSEVHQISSVVVLEGDDELLRGIMQQDEEDRSVTDGSIKVFRVGS